MMRTKRSKREAVSGRGEWDMSQAYCNNTPHKVFYYYYSCTTLGIYGEKHLGFNTLTNIHKTVHG